MKKLMTIAAVTLGMLFFSLDATAQNGNAGEGQAISAFRQTCNYQGPVEVVQVNVISACFAGGFITEYLIAPKVNCNQVDCDLIRIGLVGRVVTGCDGNVIETECLGASN